MFTSQPFLTNGTKTIEKLDEANIKEEDEYPYSITL